MALARKAGAGWDSPAAQTAVRRLLGPIEASTQSWRRLMEPLTAPSRAFQRLIDPFNNAIRLEPVPEADGPECAQPLVQLATVMHRAAAAPPQNPAAGGRYGMRESTRSAYLAAAAYFFHNGIDARATNRELARRVANFASERGLPGSDKFDEDNRHFRETVVGVHAFIIATDDG